MSTTPNSLFVFPETGQPIRVAMCADTPWFVAADVCAVLGMDTIQGTHKWLVGIAADEKRLATTATDPQIFRGSKARSATLLSESGLYKLIMRSDKPEARPFQNWVTRDVLPAIRKDGAYVRGEELLKPGVVETLDLNDLDALRDRIETLLQRKAELLEKRLAEEQARREAAEAKVAEQAPAVAVFEDHYEKAARQSVSAFARTLDALRPDRALPETEGGAPRLRRSALVRPTTENRGHAFATTRASASPCLFSLKF
ncbi:hypothetical protein KPL78_12385 [Roseomonas sp. HJA6]|uniref:Bro-N domain-containing protein n=1 Tax=Roseomonas alba TaxID=2846776 RepID=A0ABS7A8R3_9PROT|nr:BRO family protein [Neoroseomonas alba]MBW6398654.1 hypothetical protein [Neoroseomonas alba]